MKIYAAFNLTDTKTNTLYSKYVIEFPKRPTHYYDFFNGFLNPYLLPIMQQEATWNTMVYKPVLYANGSVALTASEVESLLTNKNGVKALLDHYGLMLYENKTAAY